MRTFLVYGSHGTVEVSADTGRVTQVLEKCDSDCKDCLKHGSYGSYTFDVEEWKEHYPTKSLEGQDLDILDLGYKTSSGQYEEADNDWRANHKEEEEIWKLYI